MIPHQSYGVNSRVEFFLSHFEADQIRKTSTGWAVRCPAHDDRNPSLSVDVGNDGRVLIHCHAGCPPEKVVAALGLTMADLMPEKQEKRKAISPKVAAMSRAAHPSSDNPRTFPNLNAVLSELEKQVRKQYPQIRGKHRLWFYRDQHDRLVGAVVRWDLPDGKVVRPVSLYPDGWRIAAMSEPRPLYQLADVKIARQVVVVEGELCADTARHLGLMATTSAGGANAAHLTDWSPLAGKDVIILPDNDGPGFLYAEEVAQQLARVQARSIRIVELPGLPPGGDIVDWVALQSDAAMPEDLCQAILELARKTPEWKPGQQEEDEVREDLAFRPFPVEVLPEPLRSLVETGSRSIGCDPSYIALPLLVATAAAIGNTRRLKLAAGWLVPPILWGAIVGESGSGKTPAFDLALRASWRQEMQARERNNLRRTVYENELADWEDEVAIRRKLKVTDSDRPPKPNPPQEERCIITDATIEALVQILMANPRGLLLACDELSGWIGAFDRYANKGRVSSDAAHWLTLFHAKPLVVDRKTGENRSVFVRQAAVSICGGIQPGVLKRALAPEYRQSGLAARLLMVWPPVMAKSWEKLKAHLNRNVTWAEQEVTRLIERLYSLSFVTDAEGREEPGIVTLSEEAEKVWAEYYDEHNREQLDLTDDLAAAWSKLEEYPARLALIVHFVRWAAGDASVDNPEVLDAVSMQAGIVLARWFKHEARRVYAMLDETDDEGLRRRLLEWIRRHGGTVTAREVRKCFRSLRQGDAAEKALQDLVDAGYGLWVESEPRKHGRPTKHFRLNEAQQQGQ